MISRKLFVAVTILALAAETGVAAASPTVPLQPSSKWWMDYAPDRCRLSRTFGEGRDLVIVEFTRYEPSDGFALMIVGRPVGSALPGQSVDLRFGESGPFVRTSAMTGNSTSAAGKTLPVVFLQGRLDNLDTDTREMRELARRLPSGEWRARFHIAADQEAGVTRLELKLPGHPLSLALGSMGPPMAAMRKCTTDLVREWGFDPEEQANLAAPARPLSDPGDWLGSADYPSGALHRGEQAIIAFRLTIDGAGMITACAIQSSISSEPDFATKTCTLIKRRARFEPARTHDGKPTPSYYVNLVRWIIP